MLNEINERLIRAKVQHRHKLKLDAMLAETQVTLEEELRRARGCEAILATEQAEVEKLEGHGITSLFYSILGTKEERLERERQEFLAAKLKVETHTQAVETAHTEVERLKRELALYGNTAAEYDWCIDEKQRLLLKSPDAKFAPLLELAERLAELEAVRQELREAIQAGEKAKGSLERVQSELRSAQHWGTWDMFGGGFFATMAKHSHIDAAKSYAQIAQRDLQSFREELADADRRLHVSLDGISGFSKFADYFFDGLITDWIVQSQVTSATDACTAALNKVNNALTECRRRLTETEQESERVSEERRELTERA